MTEKKLGALPVPCKSCPYRRDVPSGVWEVHEYKKLLSYDGEIMEQVFHGGFGLFLCHQKNNCLCSGWLACHGPENLLALRISGDQVEPEVFQYHTDVPVFSSGAEAAAHGVKDINDPGAKAKKTMAQIERKRGRDDEPSN